MQKNEIVHLIFLILFFSEIAEVYFSFLSSVHVARFGDQGRKDEEVRGGEPKKGV